jgi:hypothetical protein
MDFYFCNFHGPWNSRVFWPQMALAYRLDAISPGPKKLLNSRAQPLPTSPRKGNARIQNIMHVAV